MIIFMGQLTMRKLIIGGAIVVVVLAATLGGAIADRLFGIRPLDRFFPKGPTDQSQITQRQVLKEESVTIEIAKRVSPAVVTISLEQPKRKILEFSPFGGLNIQERGGEQDIATGFVVDSSGLVVTNRHVVANAQVKYKVITKDGKEYQVRKIYRDPLNDIALLKVDAGGLSTVTLGDSDNLQVGQYVAAIGTALGEFRHSVTTGVISGLGRGIDAGSGNPFEGYAERFDNVVQTDAAINPGNSGGPLVDSSGMVIGINVAVAIGAQNVGFALPINVVKASIDEFKKTGEFVRPFLGVQYQIVTREAAIVNEIPEGAFVRDVVRGSAADRAGVEAGDVITKFAGEKIVQDKGGLAALVNKHRVGDKVDIEVWRDGKTLTLTAVLSEAEE